MLDLTGFAVHAGFCWDRDACWILPFVLRLICHDIHEKNRGFAVFAAPKSE